MKLCPQSCPQYLSTVSCSCGQPGDPDARDKGWSVARRSAGETARTPGAAWAAHCRRIGLDPATEPHFSIFEAGWSAALRGG